MNAQVSMSRILDTYVWQIFMKIPDLCISFFSRSDVIQCTIVHNGLENGYFSRNVQKQQKKAF